MSSRFEPQVRGPRWNGAGLLLTDAVLIATAWSLALILRYDGEVPAETVSRFVWLLPCFVALTLGLQRLAGLYAGVLRFASVLEARQILVAQFVTLVLTAGAIKVMDHPIPLSIPFIATLLACGTTGATRFWSRLLRWRRLTDTGGERILVIGAGEAGTALVRDIRSQPDTRVVGFLDDDPHLQGRQIYGHKVLGRVQDLADVVEETGPTRAVLAITAAPPALVRSIVNLCGDLDLGLSIIPSSAELLGRRVSLQDVRDLEISDLLGRPQVDDNLEVVEDLIRGRRVLITGGGGSIGSELGRQVAALSPARLILVDHDETHLFDAAADMPGQAVLRLADIRDEAALEAVFAAERPDIVFHAAAHKHVPLLEEHPVQAAHTNVLGTANVLACARRVGVRRFVFISTDKAVRPSSVMGATKLVGEHLVLGAGHDMATCAVRFGNVLGSRGSVVPTFVKQIRAGGPVTITDARMTRYFMSIPEAVRLVLHAAAMSEDRDIFMLDMGEPVRIIDLARRMIHLSGQRPGRDVEIRVTHIRPGEKLAEELQAPDEVASSTSHPAICRLQPVALDGVVLDEAVASLREALPSQDGAAALSVLRAVLRHRVSTDRPSPAPVVIPQQSGPRRAAAPDTTTRTI